MSASLLLITANVGSVFEDPEHMLKLWLKEIIKLIVEKRPDFVGIHFQEIGGKNYETSMKHVNSFVSSLTEHVELRETFDRCLALIDDDFQRACSFTALGNLYLARRSLPDVQLWHWPDEKFVPLEGRLVHSGHLANIGVCDKDKFPLEYFPDCKWSRKGFMRTRWQLGAARFDLVNIHLFHDACNMTALESSHSPYSATRRKALQHTLSRFTADQHENIPFFMFGDFNFRVNTHGVVNHLTKDLHRRNSADIGGVEFHDSSERVVLRVGKKHFDHSTHQDLFLSDISWLRDFDCELSEFGDVLHEFPIGFPPSYPFEENVLQSHSFMRTRCPSWCDRILMSKSALDIIQCGKVDDVCYDMVGRDECMGDHKPVHLCLRLPLLDRRAAAGADQQLPAAATSCSTGGVHRHPPLQHSGTALSLPLSAPASAEPRLDAMRLPPAPLRRCQSLGGAAVGARRVRLCMPSTLRLNSHHSSSDESWFDGLDDDEGVELEDWTDETSGRDEVFRADSGLDATGSSGILSETDRDETGRSAFKTSPPAVSPIHSYPLHKPADSADVSLNSTCSNS